MFRALEHQHVEEHYVQSTGTSTCGGTLCSEMSLSVTNTTTLADLGQMLVEEWEAIPQQSVSRLVTA